MQMLQVHTLRVDGLKQPQYVEKEFQFSWILESKRKGCFQKVWRIRLWKQETLIWDSGERRSGGCFGISYEGPELSPLEIYTWRVDCEDCFGEKAGAEDTFRTSRGKEPFHTHWVQPMQEPTVKERPEPFGNHAVSGHRDYREFQPSQLVRTRINIAKPVEKAFLHISAHGLYRLEVNGRKIETHLLAPECSPYDKVLMFQSYDIKELLQTGENILGAELADGWWIGRIGLGSWSCQYGDKKELFLECEVIYSDGSSAWYGAENARAIVGPNRYADLFVGECHDAGAVPDGWSSPGFDDSSWKPVQVMNIGLENLYPHIGEPVHIIKEFAPAAILRTPEGDVVVDAGQNVAGFLRISLAASAGQKIVLEYSEMLREDGCFFQNIMGVNKDQRDVYVTGKGLQSWNPSFTYHGFRYVRITGWPGEICCDNFRVCVISSVDDYIGEFSCSDERLTKLHQNIVRSQTANTISIPTDCPQREKAGWTGDITVYAPTMMYLSEGENFLRRWLYYLRQEQFENGLVPSVIPYWEVCRDMSRRLGSDTSCGWGDAVVLVPWAVYLATGNEQVLKENYDAMSRWMGYVEREAASGYPEEYAYFDEERKGHQKYLWNTGFHFGDWLMPSIMMAGGSPQDTAQATKELFASAYYAYTSQIMSQIAEVLGKKKAAARYIEQYKNIKEAFLAEYFQKEGTLTLSCQGAYVLCLKFGLVPEGCRDKIVEKLCSLIRKNEGCLDTGFLSVPFLMDVLCENGRREQAIELLFQTRCPSWLYMVEHGATTIWESWNCIQPDGKVGTYSYNHYAFGCIGDWLYREIGGLQLLEPGYRKIRVRPGVESGLTWVKTRHRTPYGWAAVEWKKRGEIFEMQLQIPVGAEADVFLPDGNRLAVESGSHAFSCSIS